MSELNIELISVGDEILIGHTLDTNSNWIAEQLSENGLRLRWHSTVGDNSSDMRHQMKRAWNRADVVIVTGGLGPTPDDITRPVLARFFEDDLVERPDLKQRIVDRFAARGMSAPFGFDVMSEFPTKADPVLNEHGSAPGIHFHEDGKDLYALPGVPSEMREMMISQVLPAIIQRREGVYLHHVLRTTGIGESFLDEMISRSDSLDPVKLAYLPSIDHGVMLRLSLAGKDESEVRQLLDDRVNQVRRIVKDYVFTEDKRKLSEVVLETLRQRKMKLTIAESCTGGIICDRLVSIPGSSDVFVCGYITYWNEAKMKQLGVNKHTLDTHGAVSRQTAVEMATGALEESGADIALSVTGIAGPDGGTDEKPVGLVYIGLADKSGAFAVRHRFNGNRDANRRRSAHAALTVLWNHLKNTGA